MSLLIRNGRVIDPASGTDERLDIFVQDSEITRIGDDLAGNKDASSTETVDASGCVVVPGLIDAHVHLRDPGEPEKETIYTGSRAAAAGGFTTIICQPNTKPKIDTPQRVKRLAKLIETDSVVRIYPSARITRNHRTLANVREMKSAGAVAITDDGDPVIDDELLREALREGKECGIVVSLHCELSPWAEEALKTATYELEPVFVQRAIAAARKTGGSVHISHVSMAKSIGEIARARKEGLPITCEVTPHHLLLTKDANDLYGIDAKVNPPLRSLDDVNVVRKALKDGVIDMIASDHAPHGVKTGEWEKAAFGIMGLETTLGLVLTKLVIPGILDLDEAIGKLTLSPAAVFGLNAGQLKVGMPADITIIDLEKKWMVDVNKFKSKSRNSPFHGWHLKGKALTTIVKGKVVYTE